MAVIPDQTTATLAFGAFVESPWLSSQTKPLQPTTPAKPPQMFSRNQ